MKAPGLALEPREVAPCAPSPANRRVLSAEASFRTALQPQGWVVSGWLVKIPQLPQHPSWPLFT